MRGGSNLAGQITISAAGGVLRFFVGVGLLLSVPFGLVAIGNDLGDDAFAALGNPPSVTTENATVGGYMAWIFGNLDQRGTASTVNASFQWRTGSGAWSDTPAQPLADNYTGGFWFNLTGLSAGTTYEYRAHATGDGEAFGLTKTFTTIASPVTPSVVTLNATNVSYTSAILRGRLLQKGTAPSGNVTIEWGSAPDQLAHEIGPVTMWLDVPGMVFGDFMGDPPVNGLTPNTTYYFRAKAVGDGISYGEILSFTTLGGGDSGGGGGGGGGGSTTVVRDVMSGNQFVYPATAKSADQKVNISIPKDTVANTESGRLTSVSIFVQKDLPESVQSWGVDLKSIGVIYNIQPDGATFDPPIDITIKYDTEDAKQIPKGVDEKNLVIGTYDMKLGKWTTLDSTVDPENNTVTAQIGHFSLYTIMARTAPASFAVSDLKITPAELVLGETVSVSVLVKNTGGLAGDYEVKLNIDGQVADTKTVTLDGGASQTVNFTASKNTEGTYPVTIGTLSAGLSVRAVTPTATPEPPPSSITAPELLPSVPPATEPSPVLETTPAPENTPATQPVQENSPATDPWLIIGLVAIVVAIIGVAGWKIASRKKGS